MLRVSEEVPGGQWNFDGPDARIAAVIPKESVGSPHVEKDDERLRTDVFRVFVRLASRLPSASPPGCPSEGAAPSDS
jgi:hypothetical protein